MQCATDRRGGAVNRTEGVRWLVGLLGLVTALLVLIALDLGPALNCSERQISVDCMGAWSGS